MTTAYEYNALTSPWLPVASGDGRVHWASPVDVLCGDVDGVDLAYPRDDFRVYGRLLLSALVQALLPAETPAELRRRLEEPMTRSEIESRIDEVKGDFDLFGPSPFLQVARPEKVPDKGAAPFVFASADLYQPPQPVDRISIPIALVTVFVEQTYAGGAGRGYGAGPGGQPGAFTLIDPGSIRRGAWANSLSLELANSRYSPDGPRAWSNATREPAPRASVGVVAGLFFQPRGVWLEPAGEGTCSMSGIDGPLVRISPLLPKSKLAEKKKGVEDLWQHPCAPLVVNSTGIGAVRMNADRPAWTGLAQLLRPVSRGKSSTKSNPNEGPAPVVRQWTGIRRTGARSSLILLDFDRDKANVKRRFFESYPLADHFLDGRESVDRLRELIDVAERILVALARALTSAHDGRKRGGFSRADAVSKFWSETESPFFDWLSIVTKVDEWTDETDAVAARARDTMLAAMRVKALAIFDAHVALSEFDAGKQARIANARRVLARALSSVLKESNGNEVKS